MTTILFDEFGNAQLTRGHDCIGLTIMYSGAEMRRVTEIHMDSDTRRFFIEWKVRLALDGFEFVKRGDWHTNETHYRIWPQGIALDEALDGRIDRDNLMTFSTYENAVKYEVSCLDEMRRKGVIFP